MANVLAAAVDVAVVGAGIGGLAAALRCAAAGASVAVFERAPSVGGKMRVIEIEGRRIDAGPTVLTMREVFDELFDAAGASVADYVTLHPIPLLARHAWTDGSTLDLHVDADASRDAIERFAGAREAEGFERFVARARRIWTRVRKPFLDSDRPGIAAAMARTGLGGLWNALGIDAHRTLWSALRRDFRDPRLRQLFGRYATYYGSSPLQAPATLALIAAVELAGVWRVEGGMIALAEGIARALEDRGASIVTNAEVAEILVDGEGARGVRLADGREVGARAVVANAAPEAIAAGAFGPRASQAIVQRSSPTRSLSALTVAAVGRPRGLTPAYHTVLFSSDYPAEFRALTRQHRVPDEPTVYLCAQDRTASAREGDERLFALVNAPAIGDRHDFGPEVNSCIRRIQRLSAQCGLNLPIDDPNRRVVTTPNDFAQMFPHTGGALYGAATHSMMAPLRRPATRTQVPGLFVVGGGVHPGAGVPMVAMGGRWAAQAALQGLRSTSTFPSAATRGGTSTGSATTAASRSR